MLAGSEELEGLTPLSRRFVAAALANGAASPVWLRKGAWLFQAGEPVAAVHAVLEGAVIRRKANLGGEPLAVDLVTRGGVAGFRAWLAYGHHHLFAQCVSDTLVCRIPVELLPRVLDGDRRLEAELMAEVARDLNTAKHRILQIATMGVRDRLLVVLAQLSRDFATMNDATTLVLAPPVSRTDMAALAGMTPESLSRCIRVLEGEGLAHFSRHHVVIPSLERFRAALAGVGVAGDGSGELLMAC